MDTLLQDIRYAARQLVKNPSFTIAAVLTLGLGIGATTAIFSVVDGVLLRPTPFVAADRLAMVWETDRKSGTAHEPASVPDFQDFQRRSGRFSQLAAFAAGEVNLTPIRGEPARLAALSVSHGFLPMLGLRPLVGRTFTAEEDAPGSGAQVVLISDDLWQRLFGRDPSVVGRTLRIDDVPQEIVGVLPTGADFGTLQVLRAADYARGFADRGGRVRVDVWAPLQADPASLPRNTHPIFVVGRLADGAGLGAAQQEMAAIAADLERTYPVNDARGVSIESLSRVVFGPVRPALLVLLGAVALVLLVACANVANLLLARSAARAREVTVRRAVGATTRRLAGQFLVESALLTAAGAALGVFFAIQGVALLATLAPASIPRAGTVGVDARVLAVTLGVSVLVAIAFGVLPTLQARNRDLQASLHGERGGSGGREQRRLRSGFVVAELSLAVMLMVGAGLLIRTLWQLGTVDPGFRSAGVLKAEYQLPASRYPRDFRVWPHWTQVQRFNEALQGRLAALPGVEGVAIAANHPINAGFTSSIAVVGREAEAADWPEPSIRIVTASYFQTLGVPLVAGRRFEPADAVDAPPVILINESARRRFFAGHEPIGQRIRLWGAERLVIGVVGNERFRGLTTATPPAVYLPLGQVQVAGGGHSVLVRLRGTADPTAFTPELRRAVAELDPELPLFGVEPLTATVSQTVAQQRFTMLVLVVFAVVALLLAVIGVHGLLSYTVAQRTREIGIRMALGAGPGGVRGLVMAEGAALAAAGLALGLLGALALSRVLATLLYGVGARDPLTFVGVGLTLGLVALVASDVTARRAARMDPMVALRTE